MLAPNITIEDVPAADQIIGKFATFCVWKCDDGKIRIVVIFNGDAENMLTKAIYDTKAEARRAGKLAIKRNDKREKLGMVWMEFGVIERDVNGKEFYRHFFHKRESREALQSLGNTSL